MRDSHFQLHPARTPGIRDLGLTVRRVLEALATYGLTDLKREYSELRGPGHSASTGLRCCLDGGQGLATTRRPMRLLLEQDLCSPRRFVVATPGSKLYLIGVCSRRTRYRAGLS